MKKIILLLAIFLVSQLIYAQSIVRIYHSDPRYNLFVNYQACFRDRSSCLFPVYNILIKQDEPYTDIILPDYTDYARVINVYEYNENDGVIAQGEFPDEEDCKIFPNYPVTLSRHDNIVICAR